MEAFDELKAMRESYSPQERFEELVRISGFVAFTNQIAGSGKDSLKDEVSKLCDGETCPSLTDRRPRPSDKGDYLYVSTEKLLALAKEGVLVEYEPLRSYTYATSGPVIEAILERGKRPFKDIEPNGLLKLRAIAGQEGLIKAVFPLPDLTLTEDGRTVWEQMLTQRDYNGFSLKEVLKGSCGEDAASDMAKRLALARDQRMHVEEMGLVDDPDTLFVVNEFGLDKLAYAALLSARFIRQGRGIHHELGDTCPTPKAALKHLARVEEIAGTALAA